MHPHPQLFDQIRRAATSLVLNLAEGRKRIGRDRLNHWRIASGSADKVRAALRLAAAWGDLDPASYKKPFHLLDRLAAMLWRLTHRDDGWVHYQGTNLSPRGRRRQSSPPQRTCQAMPTA